MNKLPEEITEYFRAQGKKGGVAVRDKYGKDYLKEIGRKGLKARWDKKKEGEDEETNDSDSSE